MKKQIILFLFASCFFLQAFSAVDLVMSGGGIVPNGMTRGTSYPITVYVQNIGSTSTTTGFYVNISINTSSTYNGNQTYLTDIFVSGGIAAGQTKTLTTTITIPCSSTAGTRYILDGADATNLIAESNETNNNFNFPFLNRNLNTPLPNSPTNITQTSFQANWQTIPEATSYTLLVSLNNTFTNILPGYNNVNVGNVTSRVVTGLNCNTNYYYRVQAVNSCGSSSAVTSGQLATTNVCGSVDLIISGGIVPNGMTRGTSYPITIYVQNTGSTSTTTSFYVNISINTSSTYNGSQTYLTDIFVSGGIAAGQTKTLNTTITIPCSYTAGTRYILAGADATNLIAESNETNNNFGFSFLNRNLDTPLPNTPTNITQTSFQANWQTIPEATSYTLLVSLNNTFTNILPGYNNVNVGNVTSRVVTGLNCNTNYYYRVQAVNSCGSSSAVTSGQLATTSSCTGSPSISLSGNLAFGNVTVGTTSQRTLTISNTGNATLNVSSINYPTGFNGNWNSGSIAAGGSQNVTVTFAPTSATSYGGTITVNSNASSGTNTISCSGTGTTTASPSISLSGNLAFGNVTVGTTSQRTLTISNTGNATLNVSSINYPTGFSGNWNSGSIAAGGSQNVTVTFAPTSATSYGGTITVNSNASSGTNTISCSGTGTTTASPSISLSGNLAFGNVTVGTTSQRTLTISNTGNATLNVSSINYPTGFSGNWNSGSIAAGGSQNVTVTFAPTSATSYGGTITVNSNASSGTNTISCSGTGTTGTDPSLAVPLQITSPVGNPIGHGCECIKQSLFCQSQPSAPNYGWGFWQRGTCHGTGHSESSGIGSADDRYAWDCNMNLPYYNLDYHQNVYAVADGYIMNNSDNPGWGNQPTGQILIRHTNGTETWYSGYLHMNQITSKKFGATLADRHVTAGEVIGVVDGVTGYPPHLHFILYYKDPNVATKLRSVNRTINPRLVPASEFRLSAIGSIIAGASISIKRDSVWRNYGRTDENGSIRILLMPSIQQGDSVKILAAGYEDMIFKIDTFTSLTNKLVVPMMEQLSPSLKVKNTKIEALSQKTFYDNPSVSLRITGKNYSNYDVIRIFDGGDTTIYFPVISNNSPQDSLVNINLVDTGYNYYEFRFKGIDTISLFKSFNFAPNTLASYKTKVNFPNKLKGAHLYIDGSFIKYLLNSGDSIALLNGSHYLRIQASGYKDSTFVVNTTGAINISLDTISYSSAQNSPIVDFTTGEKIQYRKNVTLMDSSRSTIVSITQTEDIFFGLRLIPKSRKFEIQRINERWSNIRFMAVLDQIDNFSEQDVYLLNINDGNRYKKIAFSNSNVKYDSTTQKLLYNYFNFQNGSSNKEAIAIMKKQPPIIIENPGTTILMNDTLILPLSLFISDPDNLKNDLTIMVNNISVPNNQFQFTIIDSNVHIKSGNNFIGEVLINITATHDFTTITKTIKLRVAPPKSGDVLSIYPNPGSSTVIADLLLTGGQPYTLNMYDIQGRFIKTFFNNKTFSRGHYIENLNLSNIPTGTYIFKLNDKPTVKFVKVTE